MKIDKPESETQQWIKARALQFLRKDNRLSWDKCLTEATAEYVLRHRKQFKKKAA